MKVTMTGGSGLIGTALGEALLEDGHDVVVLTRNRDPRGGHGMTRCVHWDPPHVGSWIDDVAGADAVINLAGASIGRWP